MSAVGPSPEVLARRADRTLRGMSKPSVEFDASRCFRGAKGLGFYNVGAAAVRGLARSVHAEVRESWTIDEVMSFADVCMASRFLEAKGVGIELVARYRRSFTPSLLGRWKGWLADGHASNWATTDAICGLLIGPLVVAHPTLAPTVASWAGARSLWVRRAGVVGLIPSVRKGHALDLAYGVATRLQGDKEDLIQKAVGWMLREAGKADEKRLERYLRKNGPRIPRTTLRYAIERFPPARRRELLASTRSTARAGQAI